MVVKLPYPFLHFNSIKVRLKRKSKQLTSSLLQTFQFHKGTIKTSNATMTVTQIAHFNSIKVRLKPSSAKANDLRSAFQFHKGTIKTYVF